MSVYYVYAVQAETKEKELQIVLISYMVLEMSSGRTSSALNHRDISLALKQNYLFLLYVYGCFFPALEQSILNH